MPSLRPGLSGLVVLAVAAATLVGLAAPAPAATSTGEIVLPPYESLDLPGINYLNGSDAGLVWKKNDDPLRYLPTGTTTPRLADPVASASQITVSGEHLMYRMGYAHVPAGAWTVQSPVGPAVDVDLRTGVRRELTHDENDETAFYRFRGGSGDSWLELRGGHIVRINVDGTTRDYGRPPDDAISTVDSNSQIASAIDDAGVLLHWTTNSGPNFMAYLDFATGTWTKIYSYDVAPKAWQYLTMTAGVIAWPVGSTLYWLDRATLGVVHTRDLGAPIVDLAMAGGRVAVATQATGWPIVVRLGTLSGAFTTITPPMPVQAKVLPIGGGGLGVVAGQSPVNYGVYRLIPGSTELGPPALLFGANPPTFITAGLGQLGVGDLRGGSDAVVRPITVTTDAQHRVSTLTAGDLQVPDSLFALDGCQHSAGYSVCTKRNGKAGYFQEVRQNGQLVGRFAVSTAGHSAQLIQRGLLVHYSCNAAPAPCTEYSELIDLQSGKRTRLPAVNAISGDTIFFVTATGEIRSRDLGTGAETVLRSAGIPAPNTTFQASDYKLEVQGDWLRWFISRDWVPAGTLGAAESFAINLRTHQRVDLTRIDPSIGWDPAAEFAAGVVAWVDDATAVHVLDLTTGTSTVVGSIGTTRYTEALALTSEWVAWMVADGSVHVRPLRTIQAGVPRWSGTIAAPTFSPATEPYSFVGQTSRPLSAWTMTIRSSTSAKVRTLTGSARTGDVTPVWDGKDAKGHVVPDGVYTWTLTGTGPGGALQTSGATPKTVAGTVTVDSTTPTPRFAAPATAKTTGIALRWKSTEQHVTFTVKVSVGTEDKRGGWHYAKAKSWLKGVPDTTATYLNGATTPVDLTKGHRYRFTTTATDLAGNTATRIRTVAIN